MRIRVDKAKVKTKKKTLSNYKDEVWKVFSEYIRKRDCLLTTGSLQYGECITCDETKPFNQLQAGHFIAGRHNGNLFSERGVHAQCESCNRFHGGRPLEYRRQIIKLYGEGVDEELEAEARQIIKFTIGQLEALKLNLKQKIKKLEEAE